MQKKSFFIIEQIQKYLKCPALHCTLYNLASNRSVHAQYRSTAVPQKLC